MKKLRKDITDKAHTIGKLFQDNRDSLLACKSSEEAYTFVKQLFTKGNYHSPKANEILFKLGNGMSYANTLIYLQNIIFSAKGMSTYSGLPKY